MTEPMFQTTRQRPLSEYAKEAHQTSVDHGFWDPPPSIEKTRCLLHSEISEALEDLRAGGAPNRVIYEPPGYYYGSTVVLSETLKPGWKPCGVPSEIADVAIRVFDFAGRLQADLDTDAAALGRMRASGFERLGDDPVTWLDDLHQGVASIGFTEAPIGICLLFVILVCDGFGQRFGFDLWKIVDEKMASRAGLSSMGRRPFDVERSHL